MGSGFKSNTFMNALFSDEKKGKSMEEETTLDRCNSKVLKKLIFSPAPGLEVTVRKTDFGLINGPQRESNLFGC